MMKEISRHALRAGIQLFDDGESDRNNGTSVEINAERVFSKRGGNDRQIEFGIIGTVSDPHIVPVPSLLVYQIADHVPVAVPYDIEDRYLRRGDVETVITEQ